MTPVHFFQVFDQKIDFEISQKSMEINSKYNFFGVEQFFDDCGDFSARTSSLESKKTLKTQGCTFIFHLVMI